MVIVSPSECNAHFYTDYAKAILRVCAWEEVSE